MMETSVSFLLQRSATTGYSVSQRSQCGRIRARTVKSRLDMPIRCDSRFKLRARYSELRRVSAETARGLASIDATLRKLAARAGRADVPLKIMCRQAVTSRACRGLLSCIADPDASDSRPLSFCTWKDRRPRRLRNAFGLSIELSRMTAVAWWFMRSSVLDAKVGTRSGQMGLCSAQAVERAREETSVRHFGRNNIDVRSAPAR
jgi:hypothetical protein